MRLLCLHECVLLLGCYLLSRSIWSYLFYRYCDIRDLHVLTHPFPTLLSSDLLHPWRARHDVCLRRLAWPAIPGSELLGHAAAVAYRGRALRHRARAPANAPPLQARFALRTAAHLWPGLAHRRHVPDHLRRLGAALPNTSAA